MRLTWTKLPVKRSQTIDKSLRFILRTKAFLMKNKRLKMKLVKMLIGNRGQAPELKV